MRLKDSSLKLFLRGHLAAEMIDSFMDIPNPFERGEHMVVTGSAATYYNWHNGLAETYAYKPPTDLDLILSIPQNKKRSQGRVSTYRDMMIGATQAAAQKAGFLSAVTLPDKYDVRMMVKKTFEPEEIHAVLGQERIASVLEQQGIAGVEIERPLESHLVVDLLTLDPSMLKTRTFGGHPNSESSLLRREDPSASLAFKMARSFLGKGGQQDYPKPGDLIDMFNTLHTDGYVHDPRLLRVMAVVATALQVDGQFDFRTRGIEKIAGGVECFQRAVKNEYGGSLDARTAEDILQAWRKVSYETFPELQREEPFLRPDETAFVMNFALPASGDPRCSIVPDLLKKSPEGAAVFAEHPEMSDNIRNSTFMQQRVSFMQISPQEIEI